MTLTAHVATLTLDASEDLRALARPAMPSRLPRARRADGRATRRRVVAAATRLFAASGYEATSLRQIAGAAAIDLATLKYHFGDKPTLFAEVYREGHERFVTMIAPHLAAFAECSTRDEVRAAIGGLAADVVPWIQSEEAFARLVQFRLLEDSDDITGLEAELQDVAVSMLEEAFDAMQARGMIRDVDVPALLTLCVTGLPMWFVAARVRPGWVGEPETSPTPEAFTDRVVAFVDDLLCGVLLARDPVAESDA